MTTWDCPLCPFRTTGDDVRPSVIRHATTEQLRWLDTEHLDGIGANVGEYLPAGCESSWNLSALRCASDYDAETETAHGEEDDRT